MISTVRVVINTSYKGDSQADPKCEYIHACVLPYVLYVLYVYAYHMYHVYNRGTCVRGTTCMMMHLVYIIYTSYYIYTMSPMHHTAVAHVCIPHLILRTVTQQ